MYNCRAAAIILSLTLGMACAATNVAPPVRRLTAPATRTRATATAHVAPMPDAQLEKSIRARFAKSKISTNNFQVHVQGGVATIEGKTDVLQHKGTATRLAKNAGATSVVNKVAVSQAAKDKAAKNLATGRRRAQVKRSQTTARSAKRSS